MPEASQPRENPFTVGRPVQGKDRFFGRESELKRLRDHFLHARDPDHLSIVGEIRSGKTSLLYEFLRRHGDQLRARYKLVLLDMKGDFFPGNVYNFYQQLFEHTRDVVEDSGEVAEPIREAFEGLQQSPPHLLSNRISRLVVQLNKHGLRILYLLDEFDQTTRLFGADADAFGVLRSLGQKGDIRMLTASRRTILEIERDAGISSNLANTFNPIDLNLRYFNRQESCELVEQACLGCGVRWSAAVIDRLFVLSGGHPYLLQGISERLFADALETDESEQLRRIDEIGSEIFQRLYLSMATRLAQGTMLDSLVAVLSGRLQEADPADVDRLRRLAYLEVHQGTLRPFTPLLTRFALGRELETRLAGELRHEVLEGWGLRPGRINVVVEGDTDRAFLEIADSCHCRETGEPSQLQGLHLVAAGPDRQGGARAVLRRLLSAREIGENGGLRLIGLLDCDPMGRKIAANLTELGFQKNQDYLLLDPADAPLVHSGEAADVEIEDLLSLSLLARFAEEFPDALEQKVVQRGGQVRYRWSGQRKGALVEFCRQHATSSDVERLVALIRRIRKAARL